MDFPNVIITRPAESSQQAWTNSSHGASKHLSQPIHCNRNHEALSI
jgi:hypothetical protein